MYDKATIEVRVEIRNHVAELIGKLYKTKPIMLKTGVLGFERTSAESKALRRAFPVDRVSTKKKIVKHVDVVSQKSKTMKAWKKDGMSKAQMLKAVELAFAKK
jgi:hypothetical protein